MKIRMEQLNARAWRVYLSGRLDPDSADAARLTFAAIPGHAEVITVDCAALNDVTLRGLRELLIARRRFTAGTVRLCRIPDPENRQIRLFLRSRRRRGDLDHRCLPRYRLV